MTQFFDLSVPGFPEGHVWFFNPLGWQLLFVLGAVCGYATITGQPRMPSGAGLTVAAAIVTAAAAIHSLEIFCLGILLSVMGHFILTELHDGLLLQVVINAAGIVIMLGTGQLAEWYRNSDREAPALPEVQPRLAQQQPA